MLDYLRNQLNIPIEKIHEIYLENPLLFSIELGSGFIPRQKLFNKYKVDKELFKQILFNYPRILMKSYGSLDIKLRYLTKRFGLNLLKEEAFPCILNYNYYHFIRARGEIMLKFNEKDDENKKEKINWIDVLEMSDLEFCQNVDFSINELNE